MDALRDVLAEVRLVGLIETQTDNVNLAIGWSIDHIPAIVVLLILAYVAQRIIGRLLPHAVQMAISRSSCGESSDEFKRRCDTLTHVAVKTVIVAVWVMVGLMALSEVVNIAPILAGVGVVGIALGFGAQTLVRDMISGIFILVENQYSRGDVVTIAGVSGQVENINLRRTVLRDMDGTVHHVPNGTINVASNLTREWSRVHMNVQVAYSSDLDHVTDVINRVGEELAADPGYGPLIVEPPRALRVDGFGDSGIDIKILGVTQPVKQWEVAGELRRRLKRAFDEEGIEIPFPHRVIITPNIPPNGNESSPVESGSETRNHGNPYGKAKGNGA